MRRVKHRLECDGSDLLSIQQSFQFLAEKPGRHRKHEPAILIARDAPQTRLVAINPAHRGVSNCRLVRSGEDKPGPSLLEDDNPHNVRFSIAASVKSRPDCLMLLPFFASADDAT